MGFVEIIIIIILLYWHLHGSIFLDNFTTR